MNSTNKKVLNEEQSKRLVQLLDCLPEAVRAMAKDNPAEFQKALQVELVNRKKNYPSIDFVPNIAQERALKCLAAPHETYGDYPKKIMFIAANGIGKTCDIAAILLPGMCLGPEFVNKEYCNWQYFHDIAKIRKQRRLFVRLICDAKDMKEDNGSLYQQIKKWIPTAKFKDKTGDFYQTVIIGDVIIDVKTHNMDKIAHAGPDYDAVIFNEPAPQDLYTENISRLRLGGRAFLFLTPVDKATYLAKDIHNPRGPEGEVYVCGGNIWENCADIPGTRGILARTSIEFMIREWEKEGEHIAKARETGSFSTFAGVVFELFNRNMHVVDPFKIPTNWNIYHLCDPHDVKPPFAMWIARDPMNNSYIIAEYPEGDWDQVRRTNLTVKHFCRDFEIIESGRDAKFPYMPRKKSNFNIGDPNKFKVNLINVGKTLQQEFSYYGFDYDLSANDDIALGHNSIRELIMYDPKRKIDAFNRPRLFVFSTCKNVIQAFFEYMVDQDTGKLIEKWKCPIDLIRYYCDKAEPWKNISSSDEDGQSSDMDEVLRGRGAFSGSGRSYRNMDHEADEYDDSVYCGSGKSRW